MQHSSFVLWAEEQIFAYGLYLGQNPVKEESKGGGSVTKLFSIGWETIFCP